MMIANSGNLLLTICPFNQCNNISRRSQPVTNDVSDDNDLDEVRDHVSRLPFVRRNKEDCRQRNIETDSIGMNRRIYRTRPNVVR